MAPLSAKKFLLKAIGKDMDILFASNMLIQLIKVNSKSSSLADDLPLTVLAFCIVISGIFATFDTYFVAVARDMRDL